MTIDIEVCADNIDSCRIAESVGATRIELCAGLSLGGLTPSQGVMAQTREAVELPIHTMVRPRPGDFYFSTDEVSAMLQDIEHIK